MRSGHLCFITLTLVLAANGLAAQAVADSQATRSRARDSLITRLRDSLVTRLRDTSAIDSASRAPGKSPRPPVVVEAPRAVDTVVARACKSAPRGAPAPGLLDVAFRAEATEDDKGAAARSVGGKLTKIPDGGAEYIRLSEDGVPARIAASRLIGLSSISGVSEVSCP